MNKLLRWAFIYKGTLEKIKKMYLIQKVTSYAEHVFRGKTECVKPWPNGLACSRTLN